MSKQQEIIKMFDDIASSYDVANRVISFGSDIKWRKIAIKKALKQIENYNLKIADVATGTGDMVLHYVDLLGDREAEFIAIDPSTKMLEIAQKKLSKLKVEFINSSATNLPLASNSVDVLSIAYGLRNVIEYKEALKEFYRVLKSGGILIILDFTRQDNLSLFQRAQSIYTRYILPVIGGIISQNYKAYKYLPNSINDFVSAKELGDDLQNTGFKVLEIKGYLANVSTFFMAQK